MRHPIPPLRTPHLASALAAPLALAAGLIHFWVAPEHFAEATPFGLFMVVVGTAQVAAGVLLLLRPSRVLILATILLTVAVFGVFAVAYTVGLPGGGHADDHDAQVAHVHEDPGWHRDELGSVVVLSKLTELALLGVLVYLVREGVHGAGQPRGAARHPGLMRGSGQGHDGWRVRTRAGMNDTTRTLLLVIAAALLVVIVAPQLFMGAMMTGMMGGGAG